ncbi:MAG: efflux RND transporter periplasmic adaptor subunit [bacterium]
MKRTLWISAAVLVAIVLVWRIISLVAGSGSTNRGGYARPPVAVEVDSVRMGPIEDVRLFTGTVQPLYRYTVAPKVSGRLLDLNVRIGDYVERNKVVARLDDAEYQQAVLEAEANLKIAQASLVETRSQFSLAEQELQRVKSLAIQNLSSNAELETAQSKYDASQARLSVALAQVQQRQAALESARIRLNYTLLRASEPGYIGERYVDEGALLPVNGAVVSVIGIDTVYVRTTVIERDYGRMIEGQAAQVSVDAFPDQTFHGYVSRIAPMLREASRVAEMEVIVPNDSLKLKPGMFARVHVVLASKENAKLIPTRALVNRDGQTGVFRVSGDGTAADWTPVSTGIVTSTNVEIVWPDLKGRVITLGQHLLQDGGAILLPDESPAKDNTGGAEGATR